MIQNQGDVPGPIYGDLMPEFEGQLEDTALKQLISQMWLIHLRERAQLDMLYEYVNGQRGRPIVPDKANKEIQEIARLSIKNVLGLVRDSFTQNLSVVGYRDAAAEENAPAWKSWQRNRMDARQTEVHRSAITYGAGYVTVTPGPKGSIWRPRSPRQMLAVYDDPTVDWWPQFALEMWITEKDAKRHRRGRLFDDTFIYELDLGWLPPQGQAAESQGYAYSATHPISLVNLLSVTKHGATEGGTPVCPVVRFVNARDADDMVLGEVLPLLVDQRAINNVNFDRLVTSRFGVFPQRVITGWQGTSEEQLKASMRRVWTFEDTDVQAKSFPAAAIEPYNAVLEEMMQHVAMKAQISPAAVVGKIVNLSADALAAAEKNEQRKLESKRESFGESWEQVLRLAAEMDGDDDTADDVAAEVLWRDTEARAFGAIVDGIQKLAASEVPIESLLSLIPGVTQQWVQATSEKIQAQKVNGLIDRLTSGAPGQVPPPPEGVAAGAAAEVDQGDEGGS